MGLFTYGTISTNTRTLFSLIIVNKAPGKIQVNDVFFFRRNFNIIVLMIHSMDMIKYYFCHNLNDLVFQSFGISVIGKTNVFNRIKESSATLVYWLEWNSFPFILIKKKRNFVPPNLKFWILVFIHLSHFLVISVYWESFTWIFV